MKVGLSRKLVRILSKEGLCFVSELIFDGKSVSSFVLLFLKLVLEPAYRKFQKLILSFGVHNLLLQEVFLLLVPLGLDLPVLDSLIELFLVAFLPNLVLPDGGNGVFEL